jgi:UDP-GlcNAc:undecaprenyl-phosphate/decaprenyl-phosphate GlcNAc-1-phosphate transferase
MSLLTTLLLAVLITIALTPPLCSLALRYQWVDLPNERKVHLIPTPRVGGVAMALGVFIPLSYWLHAEPFVLAFLAGGGLLVVLGGVDDFRDLSPRVKFAGQFAAALLAVVWGGVRIESLGALAPDGFLLPVWLGVPFTLLAIVGVTNAINLADGLDGLAGGLSLLVFAGIGYLAYLDANLSIGLISVALLGALFGFLRYNTHPASVFMGDAGSQFLGFSAITLSLALTQGHPTALSPMLPLILLGFPVLDTLTVMVTRIGSGRSPFAADKNHFHHHLMALGFRHPESVFIIYVFQSFLLLAAVHFRFYSDWGLLAGYLAFCALVLYGFSHASRTRRQVRRFAFLDAVVAGRLRLLKREGTLIRYSFRLFETGVPLLLFLTCLVAERAHPYLRIAGLACAALVVLVALVRSAWLPGLLRFVFYLLIPFSVYLSGDRVTLLGDLLPMRAYSASFGAVAVLIILITKFSRRKSGFRSTPMDFLIIILALVIPNLPEQKIQEYQIGLVAAKILLLYFSFEVLQSEMRGKMYRLALWTVVSLVAFSC